MRYADNPITATQLFLFDGPPIRVRDLLAITGWSRPRVHRAIKAGELIPLRPHPGVARATVFIQREEARRYLRAMGWREGSDTSDRGDTRGTSSTGNTATP